MLSDYGKNFRAPKVDVHQFAMIPRAEIPRSRFRMQSQHKTTIQAGTLIPVYLQEILPGDSFHVDMTAYVRMATPVFPVMDQAQIESFFFFVPNRLVWINWQKFMGEQDNPADSITFSVPQVVSAAGGFPQNSIYDYFGLPCVGQTGGGNTISVSALPFRCYNLIWNQWFRDENLQNSTGFGTTNTQGITAMDNGPDPVANYNLQSVNKRHDYFTSCLPFTQKGATGQVLTPITGQATVRTTSSILVTGSQQGMLTQAATGGAAQPAAGIAYGTVGSAGAFGYGTTTIAGGVGGLYPANLYADMTTATVGILINQMRLSFQTQKLLERDARGGTRYTEIVRSHFGVVSPDMRLQRPEYLGGSKTPINVSPVPQTTATGLTGGTSPLGTLAAVGTGVMQGHGFRQSFTEHGHVLGLVCVRRDPVYQQGIRRLWSRSTRYDFFWPVFSMLGEQSVLNKEIFSDGSANDALVFGYQERWAEYRYHPSFTSALFKSTNTTPLDAWHFAQKFATLPALNSTFIADDFATTIGRNLAGGSSFNQQFYCDFLFDQRAARPMPVYSVPGMIDHF